VTGGNYPASTIKARLAVAVQMLYVMLICAIVFGHHIFPALGFGQPDFITNMQTNPMMWAVVVFFVGNTIANNLLNTGAFEIYVNGDPVWSKLQQGRLPSMPELFELVDAALARAT
jgi:selT/selW/selH-like putative selenoprotein